MNKLNEIKISKFYFILISIILSIIIWFVIQNLYIKITGVTGDQDFYLGLLGDSKPSLRITSRTCITYTIFGILKNLIGIKYATLVIPIFTSSIIANLIYSKWNFIPKTFIITSLFPHLWVWLCLASKESLLLLTSFLIVFYSAKAIYFKPNLASKLILPISLLFFSYFRPHYAISYFWIVSSTFIIYKKINFNFLKSINRKNYIFITLFFVSIISIVFLVIFQESTSNLIVNIFKEASNFHTWAHGNTTRWDIKYSNIREISENIVWGLPISFIGFTPKEIISNPKFLPSFLEGLISLLMIIFLIYKLFKFGSKSEKVRFALFFIFLPSLFLALISHYPLGLFNPGTSIRFKQGLHSIIYYYPLMILTFDNYEKKLKAFFEDNKQKENI